MGIVVITIPGNAQQEFVNSLHWETSGKVDLVIIQKTKTVGLIQSVLRIYCTVGLAQMPKEIWYALLLRFDKKAQKLLSHFREHSASAGLGRYMTKTLHVDSVNGNEAYQALARLSPELLVVWGSTLLSPRIVATAKRAINLHLGLCPYYRGALANQYAVLCDDWSKIGATIHYVNSKPDAGDVLASLTADMSKSPRELFCDLNDRARTTYLDVAVKLFMNKDLPAKAQNLEVGRTLLLKEWKPSVRYQTAKKILEWEVSSNI